MAKVIVFQESNLNIIKPTPEFLRGGGVIEDLVKLVPEGISYNIIEENQVPIDRTFRNAWEMVTNKIDVNIGKAQEIKRDQFRQLRKPILEALDIEYIKAIETKDTKTQNTIVQKKIALREITDIPLPNDIAELKDFLPASLIP